MTRRIGMVFVAIGAISVSLASVTDAEAFGRRNGCGSWGGRGSHGGSFGGFFSRGRNGSHGSYGSNGGYGSHGGRYHNGCGSHGGSYRNGGEVIVEEGTESAQRLDQRGEVRYYRGDAPRETFRSDRRDRDMAAPAPPGDEDQGRLDGDRRELNGRGEVQTDIRGEAEVDAQGGARADAQGEAEAQPSVPAPGEPDGGQAAPGTNQNPTDSNQNENQSSNQQSTGT